MTTVVTYSKEDIELLKKSLSEVSPCSKCPASVRISCCGCPEATEYEVLSRKIKESGLLSLSFDISRQRDCLAMYNKLEAEIQQTSANLRKILGDENYDELFGGIVKL